jgi:uncharacterized membrane protein
MADFPLLFIKTLVLRPYVFLFLAAFIFAGRLLMGWRRTGLFFLVSWLTAFLCEFSSTRTGFPFGFYYYTGSTVGEELYLSNVPFMDSLSFPFLLYASYCLALVFALPSAASPGRLRLTLDPVIRTSWPVLALTALFHTFIDVIIDPVALRGDRWFLGLIYGYPEPGLYFGIPLANFLGWAIVALIAVSGYFMIDRSLPSLSSAQNGTATTLALLLGCTLYYSVLLFNLAVTFWIGESFLGLVGLMIYLPPTVLLGLRLLNRLPASPASSVKGDSREIRQG